MELKNDYESERHYLVDFTRYELDVIRATMEAYLNIEQEKRVTYKVANNEEDSEDLQSISDSIQKLLDK